MLNQVFKNISAAKRLRKLDVIIRSRTDNLLNAEQIKALATDIYLNHQYIIVVHPTDKENCDALIADKVLHIYIPKHLIST